MVAFHSHPIKQTAPFLDVETTNLLSWMQTANTFGLDPHDLRRELRPSKSGPWLQAPIISIISGPGAQGMIDID